MVPACRGNTHRQGKLPKKVHGARLNVCATSITMAFPMGHASQQSDDAVSSPPPRASHRSRKSKSSPRSRGVRIQPHLTLTSTLSYFFSSSFSAELDSTPAALALAWLAKNPNTSTIILGASGPEQLIQNLEALKVLPRITDEHLARIEEILGNRPEGLVSSFFVILGLNQ